MVATRIIICSFVALAGLLAAGCADDEILYKEVKRINEPITPAEWASFLAIVDDLPEKKLPPLPSILPPAPQWSASRNRPVSELVHEEQKSVQEAAAIARLAKPLTQLRILNRSLRRERMTVEQFVGLILAIGKALGREELPEDQDLEVIATRGMKVIAELEKDSHLYSTLKEDAAYSILERAAWIPLLDQVQQLRQVPHENRDLVRKHRQRLAEVFPEEFRRNPLLGFSKVLEDQGTPFEELPETGSDDRLGWSRDQAIVGNGGTEG